MKPLLNTLYVTTPNAYLAKDGETVVVRAEQETRLRVPIHTLAGIVCFGPVTCSPFLLGLCAERGVEVSFLTESGRFLASVRGPVSGNVVLRRAQYRLASEEATRLEIARFFVAGKLANARTALLRGARETEGEPARQLGAAANGLGNSLTEAAKAGSLETLRGIEGEAARRYFSVFRHLVRVDDPCFKIDGRSRRPPLDPINALLSFLYTLLVHDARGALEAVGLDPAVGYLHEDRPGRPGLALDLVEEFRAFMADRLALTLINRRQLQADDFETFDNGAVLLKEQSRKVVLQAWQERKQEELQHPILGERVAIGLLPHVQAMLLSRYLRGELEGYPPFLWR